MAEKMRYNKIIDLLEHDKPVFSTSTVPNGSLDDLTYIADADYDAVIIEMEHEGFSFTTLRTSYPSGEGRLPSVGLMWRDCAVVQTPVFAPVQETVRWQASRYWLV